MKKLTIKEILKMEDDELEKIMTKEEISKMQNLGIEHIWQLLNAMQDGARLSGLGENEEYITIMEYLNYLEDIKNTEID